MPTGRYTDIIGRLKPGAIKPGDIVDLDGHVIGRHQGIVHFTVGQRRDWASPQARRSMSSSWMPRRAGSWSAARGAADGSHHAARRQLDRRRRTRERDRRRDRNVRRVRSTRAPQPAWLRAVGGGYEVELVAGEEGVSPGQACVFYDAPSGQARVLGGEFIRSATASNAAVRAGVQETIAPPLAEAMRG